MRHVLAALLNPASLYSLAFKIKLKGGENKTLYLILYKFTKEPSLVAKDDKKVLDYIIVLANYII
jgi:hypothetical protein